LLLTFTFYYNYTAKVDVCQQLFFKKVKIFFFFSLFDLKLRLLMQNIFNKNQR